MNIVEMQYAWFFSGDKMLDYEELVTSIRQKTKIPFISPAFIMPLPPAAPPEIPRIQMQTSDATTKVAISPNRADFFVSNLNINLIDNGWKNSLVDFLAVVEQMSEILLSKSKVVRLGLVARIVQDTTEEPCQIIASKLLKHPSNNLTEASVRIVERVATDSFTYNDSYHFQKATKFGVPRDENDNYKPSSFGMNLISQNALAIIRDINTPPEIPLEVTMKIVNEFNGWAQERLNIGYINKMMGE